jgi:hypothetical protein
MNLKKQKREQAHLLPTIKKENHSRTLRAVNLTLTEIQYTISNLITEGQLINIILILLVLPLRYIILVADERVKTEGAHFVSIRLIELVLELHPP